MYPLAECLNNQVRELPSHRWRLFLRHSCPAPTLWLRTRPWRTTTAQRPLVATSRRQPRNHPWCRGAVVADSARRIGHALWRALDACRLASRRGSSAPIPRIGAAATLPPRSLGSANVELEECCGSRRRVNLRRDQARTHYTNHLGPRAPVVPGSMAFPHDGCWRVVGKSGDNTLRATVWVVSLTER